MFLLMFDRGTMKTLILGVSLALLVICMEGRQTEALSIGSSSQCCGPEEWEAMAVASAAYGYHSAVASRPLTGRLSVSHSRNIAALWLMSELMGNVTIVVNDSQVGYFKH